MKKQRFSRRLAMMAGMSAVALTVSLSALTAQAQPAEDSAPALQPAPAGESMRDLPGVQEKRVLTVTGQEDWDVLRGFGKDADMVRMMTLMMVGGSGMEHMKMAPMEPGGMPMDASGAASSSPVMPISVTVSPNPPVVGDNTLDIAITDASGKPMTGLKLAASVAMTSMDMGTTKPAVAEGPNGHYTTVVNFSMKGPWRVLLTGSAPGRKSASAVRAALDFNVGSPEKWDQAAGPRVTLNTPPDSLAVGKNTLEFTLLDAAGQPITGAKVTTAVAMTSMEMGTAHPPAREGQDGRYATEAEFSMKGPWRVTLTITPPRGQPFTRAIDVNIAR